MQIEFNGQKEEAYSLTIYKTHAKSIASGEKTVEIRSYSNKNCEMFLDPQKLERNAKLEEAGKGDMKEWPMKDIFAIHFYDRGGRYELNVLLDYCGLACMCKEDIQMLGERFGFHDYDDEWQQYAKLPKEERPWFFWFHVSEIVGSRGL
jgi:hypothetical protein